jgi:hypothetical protein
MPPMRARTGSSLKLSCCLERPMTSSSSSAIAAKRGGMRLRLTRVTLPTFSFAVLKSSSTHIFSRWLPLSLHLEFITGIGGDR